MRKSWILMSLIIAAVVTAGVLLSASSVADSKKTAEPHKYNIVIITADAMRADMLAANRESEVRTPHLDQLAEEGVNFTRAYCNITTTTPSHATLFSSLYPFDHKAYSNTSRISSKITTLPEILKSHGWHTAGIVNLPWLNSDVSNVPQGIDEFQSCVKIRKADKTNKWVMKFLDRQKGKKQPFFLWVHYIDTHTPYYAPGEYERMYYPKDKDPRAGKSGSLQKAWKMFPKHHQNNPFIDKWLRGITDADYVVATTKGSVSWTDHNVGEMIARLKRNGQWENTIFVFTSDHGESLGEHGLWFLHGGSFEVTARVPLIIRVPGGPKNKRIDELVSLVDIMPTLLTILKIDVPAQARGRDFWESIQSRKLSGGAVLVEHAGAYIISVVTPRYKYIRHRKTKDVYPSYPMKKGKEELYDLEADPKELKNLIKVKPALAKELRKLLADLRSGKKEDFIGEKAKIDEQTEEMLRSLGYTQ
ncbi:MAG: sulfatase [Deltaproteobacteria bacterium]|nr:sulfatase [Deltaproteobacteria bacterium]